LETALAEATRRAKEDLNEETFANAFPSRQDGRPAGGSRRHVIDNAIALNLD
jgi:hypothetical protein